MSRFLLLFLFLIWMAWRSDAGGPEPLSVSNLVLFFGLYFLLVAVLGMWSRLLARRVSWKNLKRSLRYFNWTIFAGRLFIPIWFGVGVFFLGWGQAVQKMTGPLNSWPVQLPAAMVGTLPALLAWMGLWWSQFPADRSLRQKNILAQFDENVPAYNPPRFRSYCLANLRLQVLFTAVPILLILAIHDLAMLVLWKGVRLNLETMPVEGIVSFLSAVTVFLIAPLVLRHVLHTQPLPDSPLRQRMEALCRHHRLKYRDILLWRTNNNMGNAAVMGIAAPVRYILLSDLLLETMTDEQIEAVFAHEVGHVVHRHMIWYLVFMKILILALAAVGLIMEAQQARLHLPPWLPLDLLMTILGFGGFLLAFGFVSRKFERQADVFAARTLDESGRHVGHYGATLFSSALERVAIVNNIPLAARSWCHGSIASRMRTLHRMSTDPLHTRRFDRFMSRLYAALLLALVMSGAGAWLVNAKVVPILTPPAQAAAG